MRVGPSFLLPQSGIPFSPSLSQAKHHPLRNVRKNQDITVKPGTSAVVRGHGQGEPLHGETDLREVLERVSTRQAGPFLPTSRPGCPYFTKPIWTQILEIHMISGMLDCVFSLG